MQIRNLIFLLATIIVMGCAGEKAKDTTMPLLNISENNRYFMDEDGKPFFWLGDTGWLLFSKLNREEADQYLENRKKLGFNVIQVMVLHTLESKNIYGDSALIHKNVAKPLVTKGASFENDDQYDFWDHVDYVIKKAEEKGLYMALVPVWGNNVKAGGVSREEAGVYAKWLAERYKDQPNIIWLNGGDTFGSDSTATWNLIGNTIHKTDRDHLQTFHPRGRHRSSEWFHNEKWLDFNMVQSGHRNYEQDDEVFIGQDNWKYFEIDYNLTPVKPTIDGEPSYEGIPEGLHDTTQRYWNAADVRRYAYWSVFAGAFGYTYGHSAVMQFYNQKDDEPAYGAKEYWQTAINAPGALQMKYLKKLMLSRPYFERVPDQSLISGENGEKYDRLIATRGKNYAFVYTFKGGRIRVNTESFKSLEIKASWFNPRNGEFKELGVYENRGEFKIIVPGAPEDGNDWVLILDEVKNEG